MSAYVYRILTEDGRVAYVGKTGNLRVRIVKHKTKHWWPNNAQIVIRECATEQEASRLELRLIEKYRPIANFIGNPDNANWIMPKPNEVPLDPAIPVADLDRYFANWRQISRLLNCSSAAVAQWPKSGFVPALSAHRLCAARRDIAEVYMPNAATHTPTSSGVGSRA